MTGRRRRTSVGGTSSHRPSSPPEVLLCPILSPTPPCFRSMRPPCSSCRRCWPPTGANAAPGPSVERWAVTGRRCWSCVGSLMAPGWRRRAADNDIGRSTAYRYLHEGIDVLADQAPGLRAALLAARAAGHAHVTVDGTLIRTDRCRVAGPTARTDRPGRRVDLWWSGKHGCPGGQVQVIAAPDGWPIWTSPVRPGREHDTTALRTHPEALPLLIEWTDATHAALADLGYEGERTALTTPIKTPDRGLTANERTVNLLHAAVRAPAERGNSLLKTSFKALRRVSLCPWRIGAITAAALVLLHHMHDRIT